MIRKAKAIWKSLGPGLVTGASDDDPSGIATYSQAGARFGLQTLWTALITLPLMIAVLEMCARLSLVTTRGLATNLINYYPKWVLYCVIALVFPAIAFNIGADIAGMGAVANLIFPQVPIFVFNIFFTLLLSITLVVFSYQKVASILKWLCMVLFIYCIVPFMVHQEWGEVAWSTFVPTIEWTKDYLYILVAILGTTISPYLFFWQGTMTLEHKNHDTRMRNIAVELKEMKRDINLGMIISNAVMFFIILTAASVLFPEGITQIDTVDQAAAALKPLAGNKAYLLFALGVIGTGLLAIPVLSGSLAYMIGETFLWSRGIDKKWGEAKKFYFVQIGVIVLGFLQSLLDISPVNFLIYTAVAYGMICPFLIGLILHMCNRKDILGDYTNGVGANVLGVTALVLNAIVAIALLI